MDKVINIILMFQLVSITSATYYFLVGQDKEDAILPTIIAVICITINSILKLRIEFSGKQLKHQEEKVNEIIQKHKNAN